MKIRILVGLGLFIAFLILVSCGGCEWAAHKREFNPRLTVESVPEDGKTRYYLVELDDGTKYVRAVEGGAK